MIQRMDVITRDDRPWGFYEVLLTEPGIQIKRITVTAGKRLSLQTHQHREENWFITAGRGMVTNADWVYTVTAGAKVQIAKGAKHRIEALDEDVVFYEVQIGDYLGEDDIVRLEDDYGR